jgi:hypothetical protein
MNDRYTITDIDPITGRISLSFDYLGNHRDWKVFMDVIDPDAIIKICDQEYTNFQTEIDNQPILKEEVKSLIGTEKTAAEVAVSMKPVIIKEP